ncbi:MAG: serine hydrolase [Ignavibacteriae bacterium]|nr:serine hydrolase [Ignavibacteriota bacterium]
MDSSRKSLRKLIAPLAVFMWCIAATLNAQPENLELVKKKADAKLREAVNGVSGAMGFVAFDLVRGDRFAMNEQLVFPQASAIKILILMEVFMQVHKGKIKFSDLLWVEKKKQAAGSGVLSELGDHSSQLSIRDLCVLMIVLSDNTATNMLLDVIGIGNVNQTLRSLGLTKTKVQRRMLDQAASVRGDENLSTPAEAARIMEILFKGEFINRAVCDDLLSILKKPKGGAIQSAMPPDVPVAFKPGGLSGVTTEWAIVYLEGLPFVVVVMENYAVGDEADRATKKIAAILYEYYSRIATATKYGTYVEPRLLKETVK